MARKRIGVIVVPPGVFIERHEKLAADFLATVMKCDVAFLVPDRSKHAKTPDIEMSGLKWEIKSPFGKSPRTIENNLRLALRQSPNIVLDLRHMDDRIPTKKLLREVARRFNDAKRIKHIIVITRQDSLVDFNR